MREHETHGVGARVKLDISESTASPPLDFPMSQLELN